MKRLAPFSGGVFRTLLTTAACVVILGAAFVTAQRTGTWRSRLGGATKTYDDSGDTGGLSRADRRFLSRAAELNARLLGAGELAALRARQGDVWHFAQQGRDEQTQLRMELDALAKKKGLTLPVANSPEAARTDLASAKDEDFERAYAREVAEAEEDAADLFDRAATRGDDEDVRAFARRMLPAIRAQQEQSKRLEETLK
jgi:putative membrane protein